MAQIQKGTTYTTGDQVTAANLNALADSAILLPGAITDQTAKTVPLAADTVLIHSAADTALRKSTLTQLFANATGIPISTGVSGLGTGIATFLATPSSANLAGALTDETGSGAAVFATSPTLVTPILGTPSSGTLSSCTGLPISTGVSGLGTGIATALAINTGSAGAPVLFNGALGTPTSGTVTNLSGTASININGTVGATTPTTIAATTITGNGLTITNNTTNLGRIRVSSTGSTAANYRGYEIFNGATFKGGFLQDESTDAISVFTTGGIAQTFNADKSITMANGLAVTGALSSTGKAILGAASISSSPDLGEKLNVVGYSVITSGSSTYANLYNSAAGTNQKWLRFGGTTSGAWSFEKVNDAYTTPVALMTIDNSGLVGIGTTSPAAKLHIYGSGEQYIYNQSTTAGCFFRQYPNSGSHAFIENGTVGSTIYFRTSTSTSCDTSPVAISSSGLAVTGALSSTGNLSTISDLRITDTGGSKYILIGNQNSGGTNTPVILRGVNATLQIGTGTSWSASGGGTLTTIADFSSTGLAVTGALSCTGALSKGSGSFRIEHPLPAKSATHQLVHSFIEGPQADLIYRGKVVLVDGKASVNIDAASTMTEGTFEVLCRDVQCFTTNETGWTAVRGKVMGNILTIEAKDADCVDEISWMVIGERQDPHMMETEWTDDNGKVIVEPLKPSIETK